MSVGATQRQLEQLDETARRTANFTGVMILGSRQSRQEVWKQWKTMSGGRHCERTKTTVYARSNAQVSFVLGP